MDGGDIENVSFPSISYDVKTMINEYDDYHWSDELASCLAIGDGGGDLLYFFDTVNRFGFGVFSVFMCEMGSLQRTETDFYLEIILRNDCSSAFGRRFS